MAAFKLVSPKAKRTLKRSLKSSKRTTKQSHPLSHLSNQVPQTEFFDDTKETVDESLDKFWSGFHKRGSAKYPSPKKTCKMIQSIQENDERSFVHDKVKLHDGKLLSEMFSNYIKDAKTILDKYMQQDFRSGKSRRWFLDEESKEGDDEEIARREFAEFLARKDLAKLPKHDTKDKGRPLEGFSSSITDPISAFRNGDSRPNLRTVDAQETSRVAKKTVRFKRPKSSVLDVLSVISSEDEETQSRNEETKAGSEAIEQTKLTNSFTGQAARVRSEDTSLPAVVQKHKLDHRPISRIDSLRALAGHQNKGFESVRGTFSNGMISKVNGNNTIRRIQRTGQVRNGRQAFIGRNNNSDSKGGDVSNETTTKLSSNDIHKRTARIGRVRNGRKGPLAKHNKDTSLNSRRQISSSPTSRTLTSGISNSLNGSHKSVHNGKPREILAQSQADQYEKPLDKTHDKPKQKSEATNSKEAKPNAPNPWNKTLRIMRDISLSSTQHRSWEEADYSKLSKFLGVPIAKVPVKSHILLRNDDDSPTGDLHRNTIVAERAISDRGHDKGVSSPVLKSGKGALLETSLKKQSLPQRPKLKKYDSLGIGKTAEVTKLSQFVRYEFDIPDDLDANLEHLSLHGYLHG